MKIDQKVVKNSDFLRLLALKLLVFKNELMP
jgi:hypothetical protein